MAEGIRLRLRPDVEHQLHTAGLASAGALFTLRDHARPATNPEHLDDCATCVATGQVVTKHEVKTYHIRLDADGCVIVSNGVWESFLSMADNPFIVANPVAKPPTQGLVLPTAKVTIAPGAV